MRLQRRTPPIALGVGLVVLGLIMMLLLGKGYELRCERVAMHAATCVQENRLLGLVPVGEKSLGEVRAAWVDRQCDEDGCVYAVRLDTNQGETGLTAAYSAGQAAKERVAGQISAFLEDGQENTLVVKKGPEALILLVTGFFAVGGVVLTASRWQKGKPLSAAARRALTHSVETPAGPLKWRTDEEGLDISFHDEAIRILWQNVSRAGLVDMVVPNLPPAETLERIPIMGSVLNIGRELGADNRVLVLARGRNEAAAFRVLVPVFDPEAAALVQDIRQHVGERWLGELTYGETPQLFRG